jgi:hypothetical protein
LKPSVHRTNNSVVAHESFHGFIAKIEDDSFTVGEVDLKTNVSLTYAQVKKVSRGYGETDGFTGKHTGPRHRFVIAAITIGVIVALPLILLASAKD